MFAGLLLASGGLAFAVGSEASAQGAPTTTPTTIARPSSTTAASLSFATASPVLVQTADATWRTNVVVTVSSTCPTTVSFWLILPSTTVVPARAVSDAHPPCGTSNWQVLPETLTFGSLLGSPAAATLVVSQYGQTTVPSTSGGVATTQLTLQRILPSVDGLPFGWVIVAAGAFALLFLMLALASEAGRTGRRVGFSAPVYAASSWSFKDSWATNITVVGAVFGTFISASGSVTSLFPGVPLYRFSVANAACGALVIVVPLVVAVCSALTKQNSDVKPQEGDAIVASFGAVLVGGTLTMFGVGAELTLFGILAHVSSATTGWSVVFLVALALAALIVLAYALLTTYKLKLAGDEVVKALVARATCRASLAPGVTLPPSREDYVIVSSALARSSDTSLTL
jgi:hypothetical protein